MKTEKWGKAITNYADPVGWTNLLINGGKTEENSILGEKSDEIVQSIAHMAGSKALGAITPALTPISAGVNAFGSEIEQAYQQDATHFEAGLSGLINAGAEIMFEKLSSGIELLKGTSADETAVRWLSTKVSNKLVRTLMKFGMDVTGEGAEEVLTEVASSVGRKLTYLSENEWNEILSAEDLWDAFIGGVLMGGGFSGFDIVKSKTQGIDPTSKLTETEENNVNDTYKASVSNEKLKPSEKNKIYASLKDRTIRNRASIDDINKSFSKEEQNLYKGIEDNDVKQLDEEISETLAADKENINGKLEGHNNYINPKAFIEGLWEGSRKSKSDENAKNVENSQLETFDNDSENGIIELTLDNITKDILKTKPPYSRIPKDWIKAGGSITIDEYGNWVYTDWHGKSVKYINGYPDYKGAEAVVQEVDIGGFINRWIDRRKANALAPNGPRKTNNVWHHSQDGHTMQEVDGEIHRRFTHKGGHALMKRRK